MLSSLDVRHVTRDGFETPCFKTYRGVIPVPLLQKPVKLVSFCHNVRAGVWCSNAAMGAVTCTAALVAIATRRNRSSNLKWPQMADAHMYDRRQIKKNTSVSQAANAFDIVAVPGKGLGALASRDIACGELVIAEKPILTRSTEPSWLESMQNQFDALCAEEQDVVMSLCDSSAVDNTKTLGGIYDTNSIGCASSSYEGVLCKTVSRFNHSCLPNCEQFWDESTGFEKLFAAKDISKGEELCISYVEPFLTAAQRRQVFQDRYAFQLPPASNENESDNRRERLEELVSSFSRGCSPDAEKGTAEATELLNLCDEGGLAMQAFRAQACYHAFQCLLLAGRLQDSTEWIKRACYHLELCRGKEDPDCVELRRYAEDPSSHPAAQQQPLLSNGIALSIAALAGCAIAFQAIPH